MRLLTFLLLLLATAQANGQAFWFGARGGVVFNNIPPSGTTPEYFLDPKGGTGSILGLTTSVEIKKWLQVGIGFDRVVRNYSYASPLRFRAPGGDSFSYAYEVTSRAFSGYVFANYRYLLRKSFIYAGLQFGDFQALSEEIVSYRSDHPGTAFYTGSPATSPGAFFGGQLGFNHTIKGNWSLQGEVAARYRPWATTFVVTERANGLQQHIQRSTSFAYYPVTLSINYRLNTARHKPIAIPKAEEPAEEVDEEEQ